MNEKLIAFSLELSEAEELDELALQAKSFKKKVEVFTLLGSRSYDQQAYYINTFIETLIESQDYTSLNNLLKSLRKETVDINVLIILLKVMFCIKYNILEYEEFKRYCISLFETNEVDYETLLKGFIEL